MPWPRSVRSFPASVALVALSGLACSSSPAPERAELPGQAPDALTAAAPSGTSPPAIATSGPAARERTALRLAVGETHNCALLDGGEVACWGSASGGSLGDGSLIEASSGRPRPGIVPGITGARAVAAGRRNACAIGAKGEVLCWGEDLTFQTASGVGHGSRTTPAAVPFTRSMDRVLLGSKVSCGLGAGLSCWGRPHESVLWDPVSSPPLVEFAADLRPTDAAIGAGHVCAIGADAKLACWGTNDLGQLGLGDTRSRTKPQLVNGLTDVKDVVVLEEITCAAHDAGKISCWGGTRCPPTADCSIQDFSHTRPKLVGTVPAATQLAFMGSALLVLASDGRVSSLDGLAALVPGGAATVSPVAGLERVAEIGGGAMHACARRQSGEVLCWGRNHNGQLGDGTFEPRTSPVRVRF